jgi:hypothetical protein
MHRHCGQQPRKSYLQPPTHAPSTLLLLARADLNLAPRTARLPRNPLRVPHAIHSIVHQLIQRAPVQTAGRGGPLLTVPVTAPTHSCKICSTPSALPKKAWRQCTSISQLHEARHHTGFWPQASLLVLDVWTKRLIRPTALSVKVGSFAHRLILARDQANRRPSCTYL